MTHRPFAPQGRAFLRCSADIDDSGRCASASRPYVLAAAILASAMAFIDSTVVNIAAPAIQSGFDATIGDLQWVLNGYLLMLGALMLVGGGLGDRLGRRLVFVAGIVVFAAASIACAVAPTVVLLIIARIAQGVGAALLVPQSLALIAANYPKGIRGRAIGTWAAASAVTTSIGPPLGGFLIDVLSWRVAFWINLPIAVAAIWLALRHIPESRDERTEGPVDWRGALLGAIGFGAITYGLIALGEPGNALLDTGVLVVGVALLVGFVAIERSAANPVMPLTLFRSRIFTGGNIVTVLLYAALSGSLFLLPFDLLVRRELTTAQAGLTILPFGLIIGFMSRSMGTLADKHGPRRFLIAGPLLVALACGGLALGLSNFWLGVMVPAMMLAIGMGIVVSPLTTAVMNAAPGDKSGAASGVNNAASRLAGVIAVAIIGVLASRIYLMGVPEDAPRFGLLPDADDPLRAVAESAFLSGYAVGMATVAVGALLAALAAFWTVPPGVAGTSAVAAKPG